MPAVLPTFTQRKSQLSLPAWRKWFFTAFLVLWLESRLLLSASLVGLLLVDLAWTTDFAVALAAGWHPFAATANMFDNVLSCSYSRCIDLRRDPPRL